MTIVNKIISIIFYSIILLNCSFVYADDIPLSHDNRIRTYMYNENEIFLIHLTFGFQSSVEFAKGEEVETILLGDTYAWKITPIANRLNIKTLEKNVRTNMTVITNKRTYYFDLFADDDEYDYSDSENKVYVIKFYYPKTKR